MVQPAERDGELVAHLAAERPLLGEAQMVRIAGPPPTNQAGLRGDELQVRPVPIPARLPDRQHALVNAGGLGSASRSIRAMAAAGVREGRWTERGRGRVG